MNEFSEAEKSQLRETLDGHADRLPADVANRLRSARRDAIQQAARPGFDWMRPLMSAVALAGVGALSIALWSGQPAPAVDVLDQRLASIDVLTASDDLEFFQELEFFEWLPEEGVDS